MAKKITETPMMKQYMEFKAKHPDAILLFRVGDFYETFSDDAIAAAEILGITLTKRANGSAMHVELRASPSKPLTPTCRSSFARGVVWLSATSSRIPS